MGESIKHIELVRNILEYVKKMPEIEQKLIQYDLPESYDKPSCTTEGFRPDIYYNYHNYMVIGEAKTAFDFERQHSLRQYNSYYKKCNIFSGRAIFILAVPWNEYISAKNILKRIKKKNSYDIETYVINDIGGTDKL